ncbi:MAG: valyl-tRNA synthetase [Solirubrobacterales bacterium]|jgi:valyl-tRNA synthetase|nr:valyl-tRNA synthetase [Solirubrobacterales bacterium]
MNTARREKLEATTRWDPGEAEARILEDWLASGAFNPPAEGSPEENFSIAIPPPNVTGALHMGHALNGTVQDALTRINRMQGRRALWLLGTDHAGIGTQMVVERELRGEGSSRHDLGRDAFVERVWEWRERYGSQIIEQYKRLGASCDYDRERFTLDEGYVRAVYRVFAALYEKGHIYRDNYMVSFDPGTHSAISDLEVVNEEVTDTLYSIGYPVEGSDEVLTVATVRPETMLADTAVAIHPDDRRYRSLIGGHCSLPLVGRRLPVIADEHVDPEFGTGALKITPGHDPNDFEIGRAHGLDEITVIGEDGRMTAAAGERFEGMTAAEARATVVEALRGEGRLRGEEPYTHSVPFSGRSGERIEPLVSLQWFCRMDELAAPAIEVVERDQVRIVPDNYKRVYLEWMRNIRPWCISRQLWWGHRLPVWYGPEGEEIVAESESAAREAARARGLEPDQLRQETDVLDTWFSSALWPFATLGWPEDDPLLRAYYPTSFLTTARDIIFLWVARMVMMGIEFAGDIPFRDVYVHPVIQAPDGRRMSKSLGTGIDPLDEIDVHGADALRFGLLAMSSTQDVRYSVDRVQQGRDLANKMWNASRLILLNAETTPEPRDERAEDRWILSRLERTIAGVARGFEAYDFAHAVLDFYSFFWSEFCDWYLEIVKPRLYDGEEDAAANLLFVLERVLALAHPVMPFVTEAIWAYLPDRGQPLVVSGFPESDPGRIDEAAEAEVERWIDLTRSVRRWRDLVGVAAASVLNARVVGTESPPELVGRLARLHLDGARGEPLQTIGPLEILASAEIDAEEAERRLEHARGELRSEIDRAERKLANRGFVAKAPPEVVEAEREKLARYRAELDELG